MDGERFGPYRIEALLGRGGMGEVYRAYDESQKRIVALKVLSPHLAADESFRARFRRESELAARLREAHVIPIHRYGEIERRLFIDMRLVEGSDLASVLEEQGALSALRAVSIIGQVARALDAAHADGLIHRDVKPSNVLVSGRNEDSDDDFVYLVDFGIARASEDDGQGLTKTGSALGSFDYMAPERFLEGEVDRRTDVYSLACLLYECLTGQRPFSGEGLPALMYGHLNTAPPRPSQIVRGLPEALDEVVSHGMAKTPQDRFSRAGDLAAAARRALRPAPGADPVTHDPVRSAPTGMFTSTAGGSVSRPGPAGTAGVPPSQSNPGMGSLGPISNPGQTPFLGSYFPPGPPTQAGPPHRPITGPPNRPNTGPGGASGSPGFTKGRAILVAAVVIMLVAAGTIWALLLAKPDTPTGTATSTSAVTTTVTSTATTAESDPQQDLMDLVPIDFPEGQCTDNDPAGDGDIAAANCGASRTQPGPSASVFFLYPDTAAVQESFRRDMASFDLEQVASFSCRANAGYFAFNLGEEPGGFVACRVTDDGDALIQWTQDEFGLYGLVSAPGGESALPSLFEWWTEHAPVPQP